MISAKKLFGQDSSEHRMMQWLQAGLAIRDRADGDKHKMTSLWFCFRHPFMGCAILI